MTHPLIGLPSVALVATVLVVVKIYIVRSAGGFYTRHVQQAVPATNRAAHVRIFLKYCVIVICLSDFEPHTGTDPVCPCKEKRAVMSSGMSRNVVGHEVTARLW